MSRPGRQFFRISMTGLDSWPVCKEGRAPRAQQVHPAKENTHLCLRKRKHTHLAQNAEQAKQCNNGQQRDSNLLLLFSGSHVRPDQANFVFFYSSDMSPAWVSWLWLLSFWFLVYLFCISSNCILYFIFFRYVTSMCLLTVTFVFFSFWISLFCMLYFIKLYFVFYQIVFCNLNFSDMSPACVSWPPVFLSVIRQLPRDTMRGVIIIIIIIAIIAIFIVIIIIIVGVGVGVNCGLRCIAPLTQHIPTSHMATMWESVIMLIMKGGDMTQSHSHHTHW